MAAHSISSLSTAAAAATAAAGGCCRRSTLSLSRRPLFLGSSILPFPPSPRLLLRPRPRPTVVSMLPSTNAEWAATAKWSARAIKSFGMGELEARKLKYPNTGTEALLMGMLVEGTSQAAQFLRANGITLFKVREETVKLLGKSDMYFFSPEHPPLTEPAQKALDWAVDENLKSGDSGEITTAHMLLGIWAQEDSAGHKILASLGFDNEKADELAKTASKDIIMNYR